MSREDAKRLLHLLAAFAASSREIALWLRGSVWDVYPDRNELIYDNYNFRSFGWAPTD